MKRTILYLLLASFLAINSCGPKGPTENEKLRAEVIAVHDEVMPKMGQLKSLGRKALDKAEALQNETEVDSSAVEQYRLLANDLNKAYDAMFEWMRQYEPTDGELSKEDIKVYLENQMVLVTEVNKEIKEALDKADQLLK
jgi:hypothetical protein